MASSRRTPSTEPRGFSAGGAIDAAVSRFFALHAGRMLVAVSGGLDSTVLLDAMARRLPVDRLHVGHVDHGLQAGSAQWGARVAELAAARGIESTVCRLDVDPPAGASIEAWARDERYARLRAIARRQRCVAIVCAHHHDDQIETLLIALGRGAGLRGLAAMRGMRDGPIPVLRPLLEFDRHQIACCARERGLPGIVDPSNQDTTILRNSLRLQALPVLDRAVPAWRLGAGRSIAHLAQAAELLDELGRELLAGCRREGGALDVRRLAGLSPARQALVLRCWLDMHGLAMPSSARLADWRRQLCGVDGPPVRIAYRGIGLCRYRDRVWLETRAPNAGAPAHLLTWPGAGAIELPGFDASLAFSGAAGQSLDWLRTRSLRVRVGRASDRFRLRPGGPSHSLRKLWQDRGVAPWLRPGLPVVEIDGEPVFAAGIGTASVLQDRHGQSRLLDGLSLRLIPADPADPRYEPFGPIARGRVSTRADAAATPVDPL